ncbi:MAG TPA: aromatic amino acid ammonia-lyase [Solirubrobacteraceae bacterium]|nr:aromatic amino acid ammonia-lyase [Solirubrobacteraceae bacterium]
MIVLDGASLTPAEVAAVAFGGAAVELAPEARTRNLAARAAIADLLARGQELYGATTGVGALRDVRIADSERERYQWNLLRSHAVDAGPAIAPELVRAGMVVRANQLGAGGAGVVPELLDGLIAALNTGATPFVRRLGSLGTGDLAALAAVALALLGEGFVWRDGRAEPAAPLICAELSLRDALGFMSSNAFTAGHAAMLAIEARELQGAWLAVAALSFEALEADPVVFDARVQAAVGAPGQVEVARRMRELLAGSLADDAPDRLVQGPYPFRVVPQVDGVTDDALNRLEVIVGRELNARPENALIDAGDALPNGNFHAGQLAAALDGLRSALAQSASLIAARVSSLLDPATTGFTRFLAGRPGVESGVMMLEYTAHSAAAEMRSLATPMSAQAVWASLGAESHGSLAATAARRTAECLESMRVVVACELVVAMRALRARGRRTHAAGTSRLAELAREALPGELSDRAFGLEVVEASEILRAWSASA